MATCEQDATFTALELPPEFDDLAGLVHADLRAIVVMLTADKLDTPLTYEAMRMMRPRCVTAKRAFSCSRDKSSVVR